MSICWTLNNCFHIFALKITTYYTDWKSQLFVWGYFQYMILANCSSYIHSLPFNKSSQIQYLCGNNYWNPNLNSLKLKPKSTSHTIFGKGKHVFVDYYQYGQNNCFCFVYNIMLFYEIK